MDQATCPQRNQIAEYVQGTLDERQMKEINGHLDDCVRCQAVADELDTSDSQLLEILRRPQPESPYVSEPECRRSFDRLTDLRHKFPWLFQPAADDDADEGQWDLPQVLGGYLVLERIGGHLGAVYKAFHLELERMVALKTLPENLLVDDAAAERFQREIKAVGRLDHPNIVRAYDARRIGGRRFLVMEYITGTDLAELVDAHGPLPIADACELVRQAAVGLQYVHQHGLVHRDIKPANVMLSRDGQVKLLDLGLARFRIHQPAGAGASGPGMVVGTADYMAPEQVGDSQNVDIRADIYSLGCTLYKLLAGCAPFESPDCDSTIEKLNAHCKRPTPPIKQLRDDVPDGLVAVLDRMLAKNPAERFQTPAQAADALQPFAGNAELQALVATPTTCKAAQQADQRPGPGPSNRWFWELVAGAAAVLAAVFGGTMAFQKFRSESDHSTPIVVASSSTPEEQQSQATALPEQRQTPERTSAPKSTTQPALTANERRKDSEDSKTSRAPDQTGAAAGTVPTSQHQPGAATKNKPDFTVRVELDHANGTYLGPPAGPDGKGELIRVKITSDRPGYLYLLNQQADGTLICLFPNVYQADNKIEPGRSITVPDPEGDFELRASLPYGVEVLTALVSVEPLEPSRFGVPSLTDQEFAILSQASIERLQAELKRAPDTWAEARVELTTQPGKPKHSDGPNNVSPSRSDAIKAWLPGRPGFKTLPLVLSHCRHCGRSWTSNGDWQQCPYCGVTHESGTGSFFGPFRTEKCACPLPVSTLGGPPSGETVESIRTPEHPEDAWESAPRQSPSEPTESSPPATGELPEAVPPALDEPPDLAPPPPTPGKGPGAARPRYERQLDHQVTDPSLLGIAHRSNQPVATGWLLVTIRGRGNTALSGVTERARV